MCCSSQALRFLRFGAFDEYLVSPDIIFLTAATPEQHGIQHVNCQEKEYWMAKMKNNGYLFDQDILNEVLDWGTLEKSPIWWSSNLMVFI